MDITARLARVRHVAFDLDGTLYRGAIDFAETRPALAELRELGVAFTCLTNNSSYSTAEYVAQLATRGIAVTADQVVTSTRSTLAYLRTEHPGVRSLFVLGTTGLVAELTAAGFAVVHGTHEPDAVIVGFDKTVDWPKLCTAAHWIARGKPFVATHPDRVCPTDLPTVLVDCGALCACLESATGRRPDAVLGKPHPLVIADVLARHGLRGDQIAVVGDRVYTDIAMAHRAGAVGVLVLTGESTRADAAAAAEAPDLVVADVLEFVARLRSARR